MACVAATDGGIPDARIDGGNAADASVDARMDGGMSGVDFAKGFGGAANDGAGPVAVDEAGNIVVGGVFDSMSIDLGGGPLTRGGTYRDGFFARFSVASGTHVWSRSFGDEDVNSTAGVAITNDGDVVVVGSFSGTVDLGTGPLTSAGYDDMFIVRYSSGGTTLWARRFGGPLGDTATDVAVSASGEIYVTGRMADTVNFGVANLTSAGYDDAFVLRLSSADGAPLWAKRFGGPGGDRALGVALDATGAFAVGQFSGTVDFGGTPLVSVGGPDLWNGPDVFVIKLDRTTGAHIWSRSLGGSGTDYPGLVAIAPGDRVVVGGGFDESADFGGGVITSLGGFDGFLAAYSSTDAMHIWTRPISGPGDYDGVWGAAQGNTGEIVVAGQFKDGTDLGTGPTASNGDSDVFVAAYAALDGSYVWSRTFGGSGYDSAGRVAVDPFGSVVVAGLFSDMMQVGAQMLTSAGMTDAFLVRFTP